MRNMSRVLALLVVLPTAAAIAEEPTSAAIVPAVPGSLEGIAGQVILHYMDGRSLEDAGGPAFNPFGIDGDSLLFALGSFFITADYDGNSVHEGEVAIFPQFTTPRGGAFEPSALTPPIISFAMMKAGTCHGGYVAGHPVPDQIFSVDMTGQLCHAAIVDETVYGYYSAIASVEPEAPITEGALDLRNPLDIDLDVAVWTAYGAAYALATTDTGFRFARDGDTAPLWAAIAAALEAEGLGAISVASTPAASAVEAFGCAGSQTVELRFALSPDSTGITLVAASPRRMSSYAYDPDASSELDARPARTCRTAGPGRADTVNEP